MIEDQHANWHASIPLFTIAEEMEADLDDSGLRIHLHIVSVKLSITESELHPDHCFFETNDDADDGIELS